MALTLLELAQNIGVAVEADDFHAIDAAKLTRIQANATKEVEDYAKTAPEEAKEEAVIRLAGYRFNLFVREGSGFANSFVHSGAAALLNNYRARRCGLINSKV